MISYSNIASVTAKTAITQAVAQSNSKGLDQQSTNAIAISNTLNQTNGNAFSLNIGNNEQLLATYNSQGILNNAIVSKTLESVNSSANNRVSNSYREVKDILNAFV